MTLSSSSFSDTWDGMHALPVKVWLPDENDPLLGRLHDFGLLRLFTVWVPGGISLMNATRFFKLSTIGHRPPTRRDSRLWKKHFTTPDGTLLSPADVLEVLQTDLNQQAPSVNIRCMVRIKLTRSTITLQQIPYVVSDNGETVPLALMRLIFTPAQKVVHQHTSVRLKHDALHLENNPGVSLDLNTIAFVPSLMRNSIRLYERLGYRTIHLTAGYSAGSAVWPKYAFHPSDKSMWKTVKRVMRDKISHLPKDIRVAAAKRLMAINRSDETQSIYWLSDLTFKKIGITPPTLEGDCTKHKLGGFLLQRLRWKGKLELQDHRSRRRLERYLAAKNCPLP